MSSSWLGARRPRDPEAELARVVAMQTNPESTAMAGVLSRSVEQQPTAYDVRCAKDDVRQQMTFTRPYILMLYGTCALSLCNN